MREFLPRGGVGKQGFPREREPEASVGHWLRSAVCRATIPPPSRR
jgi:hypothetical protein